MSSQPSRPEKGGEIKIVRTDGMLATDAGANPVDDQIGEICSLILGQTGYDFRNFKKGTLWRRICHRVQASRAGSVSTYIDRLGSVDGEVEALIEDLLIGVTRFFRDPEAFSALNDLVLAGWAERAGKERPLRIWVPGCASGEEAYTLAILVRERLAANGVEGQVQIFATDMGKQMLARARQGRYPGAIQEQISADRLERFFTREGDAYQVRKELREMCVFCEHNLIRDPPFSQLDLISCRNVLIYFNQELQKKLAALFHFALARNGVLFLGPSEGLPAGAELFVTMDKQNRIFRRKDALTSTWSDLSLDGMGQIRRRSTPRARHVEKVTPDRTAAIFERILRDEYTLPSAVINREGEALYLAGPLGRYLQFPTGPATKPNLFEALRDGLGHELRSAVREVQSQRERVVRDKLPVHLDESIRHVRLIVRPMPGADSSPEQFLVVVHESPWAGETPVDSLARDPSPTESDLQTELHHTRTKLKRTVEELELTNEELKSANWELVSANEELQCANEEMQTSREELQSLNEELETVNAELRQKVDELGSANSDLQNLLDATQVATIFLDPSLRITKFTPAATAIFNLIATDVGRFIGDFAPRFMGQDLLADVQEVLRLQVPIERQVQSAQGAWFMLSVRPYRNVDNQVAGAVVTFVDVSELKRAETVAQQRAQLLHLSHDAIFVWPLEGAIEYWNRGAEDLYGYSTQQALGHVSHDLLKTVFPEPLSAIISELRKGGFWVGELRHRCRDGHEVTVLSNLLMVRGEDGVERILEANRDISERKAAERRLGYLASFPEQNPNPIVEADFEGRLRYKNAAAAELFPDLTGAGMDHPWLADWQNVVEGLRASGDGSGFSRKVIHRGRVYQQILYGVPQEQVVRSYGLDVTDSTQAERILRESEQRFATAFLSGPVPIGIADAKNNQLIEVNDAWTQTYGFSREEALGKTSAELGIVDPSARRRFLEQSLHSGDTSELRVYGKGGRPLDVLVRTSALELGGRPCLLSTSLDVTARKRAEQALRDNEDFLSFALSTAKLGAWDLDLIDHSAHRSLQHDRIFGYPELLPEWTFEMFLQHVIEEDRPAVERQFRQAVETRGDWNFECRIRRRDGEIRWIWAAGRHRSDGSGQVRRMAGTVQDITERKRDEELLLSANQQLAQADQRKNEFLAVLSHELRNPLAPIRNCLHIMERVPPGSEQARHAQAVIERQTGQLARLVDDLLDVTRISRNKIQLKRARQDLTELVQRTVEDHRSMFEEAGIGLEVNLPSESIFIDGDPARLTQVVGNLLHNAAKFTPAGEKVRVQVSHDRGTGRATLQVVDTGVGIAPEMLQRLFQPFMQAEMTLDRTKGGLGLGLALVKALVDLHGGEVAAFSPGPGQGSTFVIELPADAVAPTASRSEGNRSPAHKRRVLIIEDNVDAADSLKEVLEFGGNIVEVAYTGFEGLEKARRFGPEVVLCDIGLPQMDGYEVAKAFKADESLRHVALIALSGYALPEDIQRSTEVGFERHLAKPPSLEGLEKLLQELPTPGHVGARH